jgi:hypothetical protein
MQPNSNIWTDPSGNVYLSAPFGTLGMGTFTIANDGSDQYSVATYRITTSPFVIASVTSGNGQLTFGETSGTSGLFQVDPVSGLATVNFNNASLFLPANTQGSISGNDNSIIVNSNSAWTINGNGNNATGGVGSIGQSLTLFGQNTVSLASGVLNVLQNASLSFISEAQANEVGDGNTVNMFGNGQATVSGAGVVVNAAGPGNSVVVGGAGQNTPPTTINISSGNITNNGTAIVDGDGNTIATGPGSNLTVSGATGNMITASNGANITLFSTGNSISASSNLTLTLPASDQAATNLSLGGGTVTLMGNTTSLQTLNISGTGSIDASNGAGCDVNVAANAQISYSGSNSTIVTGNSALCAVTGVNITLTDAGGDSVTTSISGSADAFTYLNQIYDSSQFVATFGSHLGALLAGNNQLASLGASALGMNLVQDLNQLAGVGQVWLNSDSASDSFSTALNNALGQIGGSFVQSLTSEALSTLSSLLLISAGERLGIAGFTGQLFTTTGKSVADQLINNIMDAVQQNQTISSSVLMTGINTTTLSSILNSIGAGLGDFLGSTLANQLINPTNVTQELLTAVGGASLGAAGTAIGSQITQACFDEATITGAVEEAISGTALGDLIGTSLGDIVFPVIGGLLGSFVGELVGNELDQIINTITGGAFNNLFQESVWDYQYVQYNPTTNQLESPSNLNHPNSRATPQLQLTVSQLNDAYMTSVNNIISLVGGTVDTSSWTGLNTANGPDYFAYVSSDEPWGNDDFQLVLGAEPYNINMNGNAGNIEQIAVLDELSKISFVGGDPNLVRAFNAWKISLTEPGQSGTFNSVNSLIAYYESNPSAVSQSLNTLMTDLQLASDYDRYVQNATVINVLMTNAPDSAFSTGWVATLMQTEAMWRQAAETSLTNAQAASNNGDVNGQIYWLNWAAGFDDSNPTTFFELGQAYLSIGNSASMQNGIYNVERGLQLDPSNGPMQATLGYALFATGNVSGGRYALEVAFNLGVTPDSSQLPHATASDLASYIAGAQLTPDASANSQTPAGLALSQAPAGYDSNGVAYYKVDPYFASSALIGFLDSPSVGETDKFTVARNYFNWYLDNLNPDGTINVFWQYSDGTEALPSSPPDSNDSYASDFFLALNRYYQLSGDKAFFMQPGVQDKLSLIGSMLLKLQQPTTGLTSVFLNPSMPQTSYLEDNSESYAGMLAFSNIQKTVYGDLASAQLFANAAARVQAGIMNYLYDPSTGLFAYAIGAPTNPQAVLSVWYPGTISQVWPILFGVIPAKSAIALNIMAQINSYWNGVNQQEWTTRTDSAALAYAALLTGDPARAQAAFAIITQGPFPTFNPSPNNPGVDVAVTSIEDWNFVLQILAPVASNISCVTNDVPVTINVQAAAVDLGAGTSILSVGIVTAPTNGTAVVQPDGTILFTPNAGYDGSDSFVYSLTDADGAVGIGTVSVNASGAAFSQNTLPLGQVGTPYTQSIFVSGGTASPYFGYAITSGSLPPGLLLLPTGILTGTPTTDGTFQFTVSVADTNDGSYSQQFTFTACANTNTVVESDDDSSSVYGQAVTFTATVSATAGSSTPTGSVQFVIDGQTFSQPVTLANGIATITTAGLTAGDHTVAACYQSNSSGFVNSDDSANPLDQYVDPLTLTPVIQVSNKPYDGSTSATIINETLVGVIGNDDVILTGGTATFDDPNIGVDKTVTISGLSLTGPDAGNYSVSGSATTTANITATPTITWRNPTAIIYGTALSATQLDAMANTAGSFSYTLSDGAPANGAVLNAGQAEVLDAAFGPTDTVDYNSANAIALINVLKAIPTFSSLTSPTIIYGTATTVVSGHLSANAASQLVPAGETVQITLNGITQNAVLDGGDNFSTGFATGSLLTANSPYNLGFSYLGDTNFNGVNVEGVLHVNAPVFVFNPSTLPNGQTGAVYSQTFTISGGTAPYGKFTVSAGNLPAGLTVSPTGMISGTPTTIGTFNFTVSATDSSTGSGPFTQGKNYSITITPGSISLSQSTVSATPATIQAGGTSTVVLTTRDAYGNRETGGQTVVFGLGAGAGIGSLGPVKDNGDGTYTAIFTGTTAGIRTITAAINGQLVTSTLPSVHVTSNLPVPTVTGISPASGPGAGGTTVTVKGTNLLNAVGVYFGQTPVSSFLSNTATQIVLRSPIGVGAVSVTVVTVGGTSTFSTAAQFNYIPGPAVTGVSPAAGPLKGGTTVTITGTNLTNANAVYFGTIAVTSFVTFSPSQIVLRSPAGAGTVNLTVATPGGTSSLSASAQFSYVGTPIVTALSVSSGPTLGGTVVTVTGNNLANATAVNFGTTASTSILSTSPTQIIVVSPAATSANIVSVTVTTAGGVSASSAAAQFTYLASPYRLDASGNLFQTGKTAPIATGVAAISQGYDAFGRLALYAVINDRLVEFTTAGESGPLSYGVWAIGQGYDMQGRLAVYALINSQLVTWTLAGESVPLLSGVSEIASGVDTQGRVTIFALTQDKQLIGFNSAGQTGVLVSGVSAIASGIDAKNRQAVYALVGGQLTAWTSAGESAVLASGIATIAQGYTSQGQLAVFAMTTDGRLLTFTNAGQSAPLATGVSAIVRGFDSQNRQAIYALSSGQLVAWTIGGKSSLASGISAIAQGYDGQGRLTVYAMTTDGRLVGFTNAGQSGPMSYGVSEIAQGFDAQGRQTVDALINGELVAWTSLGESAPVATGVQSFVVAADWQVLYLTNTNSLYELTNGSSVLLDNNVQSISFNSSGVILFAKRKDGTTDQFPV